jgi:alanine-glyoxylate transaminase / serine-glyoxylate transaminase / serine-pyruvate transaminase
MISSFHPPVRVLMGPGPSDVSARVLAAMGRPTIGHLDPEFIRMMDEVKLLLQYAFRTANPLTIPVSGPGSAGMEACFANLVEAGDTVIVCVNGVFGMRMAENVRRMGATAVIVNDEWGKPIDPARVEAALQAHPRATLLAFVHAETSTGARSDAVALCALARQYDCLSLMDAVTSLGGIGVDVDGWGVDAVYSGTQKCLSCPPGISPITMSASAVRRMQARTTPVQSWFLDLNLVMAYWGGEGSRTYHHTAPVNAIYGLHEALLMLQEEGLENAWARHAEQHRSLQQGIESLGLSFLVEEQYRLPQLNAIRVPEGVDEARVRAVLLDDFGIEIGAGLGVLAGSVWRVGLMGQSANRRNVNCFLSALRAALI